MGITRSPKEGPALGVIHGRFRPSLIVPWLSLLCTDIVLGWVRQSSQFQTPCHNRIYLVEEGPPVFKIAFLEDN